MGKSITHKIVKQAKKPEQDLKAKKTSSSIKKNKQKDID